MSTYYYDTFATSFGPFSLAVDEAGAVAATAFGERDALRVRLGPGELVLNANRTHAARAQLETYLAGERRDFSLALAPRGTRFQHRVWAALRAIPFGETRTYGQLAALLGNPSAARAVGRANATNPICVLVPCHRVIGADGSLTGFAFGEDIKRRLLALENVPAYRAA
jgi:methylated-DNA-[protein]-cysteine S-methyltransferase